MAGGWQGKSPGEEKTIIVVVLLAALALAMRGNRPEGLLCLSGSELVPPRNAMHFLERSYARSISGSILVDGFVGPGHGETVSSQPSVPRERLDKNSHRFLQP